MFSSSDSLLPKTRAEVICFALLPLNEDVISPEFTYRRATTVAGSQGQED